MEVSRSWRRDLNDIEIELVDHGMGLALRLRQIDTAEADAPLATPERRILQILADAAAPVFLSQIRQRAATRHKTVAETGTLQRFVCESSIRHDV